MDIDYNELSNSLIGMDKDNAIKIIKHLNIDYRIVFEEGEVYVVTSDLNPSRINLNIYNNKIINANVG